MALWSAVESLASDVWICAVNLRPDLFAARVLRDFSEALPEGMSSRSIPLGIAARYKFDLRRCIGDIIGKRIDFTNLDDIRKAYKSAFELDDEGTQLLQSEKLKHLVLIRNLIAHRNGVIDDQFKLKTKSAEEVGEELTITDEIAANFAVLVEKVGLHLLRIADDALAGAAQKAPLVLEG